MPGARFPGIKLLVPWSFKYAQSFGQSRWWTGLIVSSSHFLTTLSLVRWLLWSHFTRDARTGKPREPIVSPVTSAENSRPTGKPAPVFFCPAFVFAKWPNYGFHQHTMSPGWPVINTACRRCFLFRGKMGENQEVGGRGGGGGGLGLKARVGGRGGGGFVFSVCFTYTETIRTIRVWVPRTATSTFTQLWAPKSC